MEAPTYLTQIALENTSMYSPRKVLQMYSEIWLPDLDSLKWLSSLLSIRLN